MNAATLFLPCAAGVEPLLADEVARITTPVRQDNGNGQPETLNVDAYQLGGGFFAGAGLGMADLRRAG